MNNKLRLTPDRLMNARRITRVCMWLCIGIILLSVVISRLMGINENDPEIKEWIMICIWLTCMPIGMYGMMASIKHRTVCKALAGLELHQYHCAEDLVFLLGIEYDLAEDIISGEYDCLLTDRLTCYYIH